MNIKKTVTVGSFLFIMGFSAMLNASEASSGSQEELLSRQVGYSKIQCQQLGEEGKKLSYTSQEKLDLLRKIETEDIRPILYDLLTSHCKNREEGDVLVGILAVERLSGVVNRIPQCMATWEKRLELARNESEGLREEVEFNVQFNDQLITALQILTDGNGIVTDSEELTVDAYVEKWTTVINNYKNFKNAHDKQRSIINYGKIGICFLSAIIIILLWDKYGKIQFPMADFLSELSKS